MIIRAKIPLRLLRLFAAHKLNQRESAVNNSSSFFMPFIPDGHRDSWLISYPVYPVILSKIFNANPMPNTPPVRPKFSKRGKNVGTFQTCAFSHL